jgi:hypothetical protein
MSKKEREINDWLVKHGFNPLPMSDYGLGESPSEVVRRLKGSSKDETTAAVHPPQDETFDKSVRPHEAKPKQPTVRRKAKLSPQPRSSKR